MKVTLKRYTNPQTYAQDFPHEEEHHDTVKSAISKVRGARKRYQKKNVWSGWKIFDKNNELVHKLI